MNLDTLLNRARKIVQGTVRRVGSGLSNEDREDVESEAMIQIYNRCKQAVEEGDEAKLDRETHEALIITIAKSRTIDLTRKQRNPTRSAETGYLDAQSDDNIGLNERLTDGIHMRASPDPFREAMFAEKKEFLYSRLSAKDQRMLDRMLMQYTNTDIAEEDGIPRQQASNRMQELKRRCERILAEYDKNITVRSHKKLNTNNKPSKEEHVNGK